MCSFTVPKLPFVISHFSFISVWGWGGEGIVYSLFHIQGTYVIQKSFLSVSMVVADQERFSGRPYWLHLPGEHCCSALVSRALPCHRALSAYLQGLESQARIQCSQFPRLKNIRPWSLLFYPRQWTVPVQFTESHTESQSDVGC